MKKFLLVLLPLSVFLFSTVLHACSDSSNPVILPEEEEEEEPSKEVPSAKGITDMALIYHTGKDRPKWTSGELSPYLFRENKETKTIEWLFDGFLFLEIRGERDGEAYDYALPSNYELEEWKLTTARKQEWNQLVTATFADKCGPNALEIVLDSMAQKGHVPKSKRQVVIAIPNPFWGQQDWGSIDGVKEGKPLVFYSANEQLAAVKWYVDRVEEIWKSKKYKHIELTGFYWLNESLIKGYGDHALIRAVQPEIEQRGYDFIWIPYNGAGSVEQWKDFKFTTAYQQPNYFFDNVADIEKMERALKTAEKYNMALEMEFDDRILTDKATFLARYYTYIDEFEKANVWKDKPVAYYQGTAAWLKMSRSLDPDIKEAYKKLADILVARQGKFSTIIKDK